MVVALILWLYIFILLYIYGAAVLCGMRSIFKIGDGESIGVIIPLFTGLTVVTVLAMTAHLFMPLGGFFMLVLSAGALIIALRWRRLIALSLPSYYPLTWVVLVFLFVISLENVTHAPTNLDTGLYHAQTIRWFETYRIVPGLGNLQLRYAFNSSWLVLNSAFSMAFLGLRSFRLMNGLIFLTSMYYFAGGINNLFHGQMTVSGVLKILFLPLGFYLLSSDISSVGNDMPVTLLTWVILLLWLEDIESPTSSSIRLFVVFILCVYSITVKLSSAPILLFALFILIEYLRRKEWKLALSLALVGGVILLPWLIRSVILSGHLVFPQSQIDIFSVDWKMPKEQVDLAVQGVLGLARVGNSWRPSMDLSFWQWFPDWFDDLTLNRQAMVVFAAFSPIPMLAVRYRRPSLVTWKYLFAYLIAYIGSSFWFFSAPNIRFGYGFLVAACVLPILPLIPGLFHAPQRIAKFTAFVMIVFLGYMFLNSFEAPMFSQRWLLPADYPPSKAQECEIDGVVIYCRKEGELWSQCYYDPFPCIPIHRPDAEMRGSTLQDGFRPVSTTAP